MKNSIKTGVLLMVLQFFVFIFAFFIPMNNYVFANAEICNQYTSAKAMIVIEKDSGRVLYSKNENERLPMASLTKIITALYVITHIDNLDEVYEIMPEAVGVEGTSIGLKAYEHLSVRELLYRLMLRSGNDSAVALSIIVSGSESNFVKEVNIWLNSLGFKNTQIKNPHGLHHEDHFTTARELAMITAIALNNPVFQDIVKTKEKAISNELKSKTSRILKSKNRFLKEYEFADGVKTGYTKKAGRCFVGSSTKNNMQVICVLLNCVPMFEECETLIKKAFDEYKLTKILSKEDFFTEVNVINGKNENNLKAVIKNDFYYPLKNEEIKYLKIKVIKEDNLKAPINIGDKLGSIEITFENQLIFSDKIYSINYIESNSLSSNAERIIKKM